MRPSPPPFIYAGFLSATLILGCKAEPEGSGSGGEGGGGGTGDVEDTGGNTGGDTGEGATWDPRFDPLVAQLQTDLEANLATGVSVAIWHDGELVFVEAFGMAKPNEGVELTPSTLLQIGSSTKMQTAVGLLQQVDGERLSLDDTLDVALPAFEMALNPGITADIEVGQLLSHQGGFYDWIDWAQDPDDALLQSYTYEVYAENLWVMNPPGAFWNYSNPNFILAGVLTEDLDPEGRPWPDYMVEEVYQPLGMDRTFARRSQVVEDGDYSLGTGFVDLETGELGEATIVEITDPGWARPAGLTWSTPTQMVDFGRFLMSGNDAVLDAELVAGMHTNHVEMGLYPDGSGYGHGLMIHPGLQVSETEYLETPVWEHGGNTLWFTSNFYVLPDHDFVLSILSNGYGDDFTLSVSAAIELTIDDLPEPITPLAFEIDPDGFDAHVGTYDDPFNVGEMIITREGDALHISMPTLEDVYGFTVNDELYSYATDIHFVQLNGGWYDLRFLKESAEDTDTTWVANRAFVCTRTGEEDVAKGPPGATSSLSVEQRVAQLRRSLAESRLSAPELPVALRAR